MANQRSEMAMTPRRSRANLISLVAAIAVAAGLGWLIATQTVAAYLAEESPAAALGLNPHQPVALVKLAQARLLQELDRIKSDPNDNVTAPQPRPPQLSRFAFKGDDPDARDVTEPKPGRLPAAAADEIRALAQRALALDPLSSRPLLILGQLALLEADKDRASRFMQAAARRSLHESVAVFYMLQASFEARDFEAASRYADVLMRTRPDLQTYVVAYLARLAETPQASQLVRALIVSNPPWRSAFLSQMPSRISDGRTPLNLLLALQKTAAPPTPAEVSSYLNFLLSRQQFDLAYYAWLQFLPAEQLARASALFNGSFETVPSGLPFDWTIRSGSGVTLNIARRLDKGGERALNIEFGEGRVNFGTVSQVTMLTPGRYRFVGSRRGTVTGRRGLVWRIACLGTAKPLGHGSMDLGFYQRWQQFEFEFTVPASDCRAQNVELVLDARSASERLVSGTMWYDDLAIERMRDK
jgi:hypothetical protein